MSSWSAGEMELQLRKLAEQERTAVALALLDAAAHVLKVSNTRVPFEEGDLEASGRISADAVKLVAAVSYKEWYAVEQHENPKLVHDGGRQAKYLESALFGERRRIAEIIATAAQINVPETGA